MAGSVQDLIPGLPDEKIGKLAWHIIRLHPPPLQPSHRRLVISNVCVMCLCACGLWDECYA